MTSEVNVPNVLKQGEPDAHVQVIVRASDPALAALYKVLTIFLVLVGVPASAWLWQWVLFR